ncbi:hypothetical protein [Pontibacter pamirensis]|uniref:hypothetical protein n=1 Tax=Pontibacter pamirensis TaxID=2562824 RepID=UPI001389ECD7|nr:hypothetical protein [Pontibacter pamirensis]
MRKFAILLCLAAAMTFSCDNHRKHSISYSSLIEIDEAKESFPDSLVDHFPKRITYPEAYVHEHGSDERNISLQLNLKFSQSEIDSIDSFYKERSKKDYNSEDSCLLIVNRFVRRTQYGVNNTYKASMDRPADCGMDYLPIINFWSNSISTTETRSRLPNGFKIFVLDSEAGIFSNHLNETSGRYMPDEWKHGYSKGVAINKEKESVIYWIAVW